MTEIQVISPAIPGNRMPRFTAFLFGGVAYLTFLFHDSVRHRLRIGARHAEDNQYRREFGDIRGNPRQSRGDSAIRHPTSARACNPSKHWWTQFIPMSVERSTMFCAQA